jgi:transcriptional regulator of acetoin/glycerol metabolism
VDLSDLPPQLRAFGGGAAAPSSRKLEDVERAHIESILKSVGGARSRAAAILGIDRKTLYRRLLRYGFVEREDEKEASA